MSVPSGAADLPWDYPQPFVVPVVPEATDIDGLRHTNNAIYVNWCELAGWAQHVIVAPATANTIARLAHGMADDLVSTLCLATEAPLAIAPAMNHRMWRHPATQANIATLRARGVQVIGPGDGPLAEGESGPGRMAEPAAIVATLGVAR